MMRMTSLSSTYTCIRAIVAISINLLGRGYGIGKMTAVLVHLA